MKAFALVYLLLVSFLTVQPLLAATMSAQKATCCTKESCSKESDDSKNTDCRNKTCNPFVTCAYGNYYFLSNSGIVFKTIELNKQKIHLFNDNRLSSIQSDCWHPPQV